MANLNIPFTTPGNYTFDSDKIEVSGGYAKLANIAPTPFAHYKMNDNEASTIILDSGSGGNNGVIIGGDTSNTLSTTGKINNALRLNSGGDLFTFNNIISTIQNDTVGSISLWVKPVANTCTYFGIGNSTYNRGTEWLIIRAQNNNFWATFYTGGVVKWIVYVTPATYLGVWHHIVLVQDGANTTIYCDNVAGSYSNETDKTAWLDDLTGIDYVTAGGYIFSSTPTELTTAPIDDVRIYREPLSSADRASIYNNGNGAEEITLYASDNPDIYQTLGTIATSVVNWSTFVVTKGTVDGTLTYQLSNDGVTWYYWNGASWAEATSQSNTEATVNTNISSFPVTNEKLYVKSILTSDGSQLIEIDNIAVSFVDNISPIVDAGTDKSAILNETIAPFSNATFSDADGSIVKAEYRVDGEVDSWTEIPQGIYGTLLEAVQAFTYNFSNVGSLTARLRVTDNNDATNTSDLLVTVAKTTVTINITDIDTGLHLSDVTFTPGDGESSSSKDSPFTYDYGLGDFTINLVKDTYYSVITDITVAGSGETKNLTMPPLQGVTETVEEIIIDIDTNDTNIEIEV